MHNLLERQKSVKKRRDFDPLSKGDQQRRKDSITGGVRWIDQTQCIDFVTNRSLLKWRVPTPTGVCQLMVTNTLLIDNLKGNRNKR